jgi:hypothetical protein
MVQFHHVRKGRKYTEKPCFPYGNGGFSKTSKIVKLAIFWASLTRRLKICNRLIRNVSGGENWMQTGRLTMGWGIDCQRRFEHAKALFGCGPGKGG